MPLVNDRARAALPRAVLAVVAAGALCAPAAIADDIKSAGVLATEGKDAAQLKYPAGVATHRAPEGNSTWVWVADSENHRVQAYDAATLEHRGKVGGPVTEIFAKPGELMRPWDVDVVGTGAAQRVWVLDFSQVSIQSYKPDGTVDVLVQASKNQEEGSFFTPVAIAASEGSGAVYVADQTLSRVTIFGPDGSLLGTWGGPGAGLKQLAGPRDLVVEPGGAAEPAGADVVWVADYGNNRIIRAVVLGGKLVGEPKALSIELDAVFGLARKDDGLVVLDAGSGRVGWYGLTGTHVRGFGSLGSGLGQFQAPTAVAAADVTLAGQCGPTSVERLFVSEEGNHRVQVVDRTLSETACPPDSGGGDAQPPAPGGGQTPAPVGGGGDSQTPGGGGGSAVPGLGGADAADRQAPTVRILSARLDKRARAVKLRVRFGERGSLTVRALRGTKALASRSLTVKAGDQNVTVKPRAKVWRQLTRRGKVSLKLVIKDRAGHSATASRTLTVR